MEANQTNEAPQAEIPVVEQEAMDTRTQRDEQDFGFEQAFGLPIPQEDNATVPPGNAALNQEQPVQAEPVPDFSQNEIAPEGNDDVRYNYWQSQAAQMKNQLDAVKEYMPMVDYLRNNPEAVQNITPGGQTPADAAPTSQAPEEFPPPPEKPEQPRGFSREEAMSDPSSDSAVYLDTVDKWRDDMQTYSQLASQYEIAKVRENYDEKVSALEKQETVRNAKAAEAEEMGRIRSFVGNKYQLGDKLDDFITTMNDPKSINMDDLVGYYQYKNGMASQAPQTQQPPQQPTNNFRQTQRAQSVPRPMGVQPSANPKVASSDNDFMSSIIKDNNNKSFL